MGTNHYLKVNVCEHCGRAEKELHVGKSSPGWRFLFHGIPGEVETRAHWLALMRTPGHALRDEYGKPMTVEEFETMTAGKQDGIDQKSPVAGDEAEGGWLRSYREQLWYDPDGYTFDRGEFC